MTNAQVALLAAAQCGGGTPTQVKQRAETFLTWLREQAAPDVPAFGFGYGSQMPGSELGDATYLGPDIVPSPAPDPFDDRRKH